jgi:PAS domain S-box-containing protein
MKHKEPTKEDLIKELAAARQLIGELKIADSKHKRTEEALRESEEKYRLLAENAHEAIFVVQDDMIRYANVKASELSGYSKEDLTFNQFLSFLHPEDREMVLDRHQKKIRGETLTEIYSFRIVNKDGTIRWVETNTVLIFMEGRPATLNFLSDITDRKQSEEELKESERRYQTLAENVHDMILVFDLNLEPTYISPSVKYLSGYNVEEAMKHRLDQILTPESYKRLIEIFEREISFERSGQKHGPGWSQTIEQEILRRDGATVWIEVTLNLIYDEEGILKSIVGIARDITERKLAALEREQLLSELQQALANVKTLSGLLPICANCKKIRDDKGYWNQIESYISEHSEAVFSHGICPECTKQLYPDFYNRKK